MQKAGLARLNRSEVAGFGVRVLALEEHFGDAGGGAEVAVDLEGRVCVEEVGEEAGFRLDALLLVGGGLDQVLQDAPGMIAIEEARPEVQLPAHRPAGGFIAAKLERLFRGGEQLRTAPRCDFRARIYAPQMR